MDRHDLKGHSAADVAEAHRKDLEVQDEFGVTFLTYWFDLLLPLLRMSRFAGLFIPGRVTGRRSPKRRTAVQ
jgi:hypothetical protein